MKITAMVIRFIFFSISFSAPLFSEFAAIPSAEDEKKVDAVLNNMRAEPSRAITLELYPSIGAKKIIDILVRRIDINENDSDSSLFRQRLVTSICLLSIYADESDSETLSLAASGLLGTIADLEKSKFTIARLLSFPLSSFGDEGKAKVESIFNKISPTTGLIRLVGKMELRSAIPKLQLLAGFPARQPTQFIWDGDPALEMFHHLNWSAAVSLARMGDKPAFEGCVRVIRDRIDQRAKFPIISLNTVCQKLGDEIIFMANNESHKILLAWLDNLLPDKEDHDGMQSAAIKCISTSVIGCPPGYNVIDIESLEKFRKWFVDNPDFTIRR